MKNMEREKLLVKDAFLMAIPDDPYLPCPCGCGKKWRFVVKGGEEEIKKHEQNFVAKYIENK